MAEVIFKQLVLCDDIRVENTGKFLIVGAYPEGIVVGFTPSNITIALWILIQVEANTGEDVVIEIEIRGSKKEQRLLLPGLVINEANYKKVTPLVITQIPLHIEEAGNVEIALRQQGKKKWDVIKTFPIELAAPL